MNLPSEVVDLIMEAEDRGANIKPKVVLIPKNNGFHAYINGIKFTKEFRHFSTFWAIVFRHFSTLFKIVFDIRHFGTFDILVLDVLLLDILV